MHASERDDDTISQLTSKLPTPPPRPSSIASSSRTSRRSSNASSMIRQPRLYETEPVPAPPPPNSSWVATRKCKSSLESDGPTITIGMLPSAKAPQRPPARKRVSTFAEQFKSLVCTSALLNNTLSIAAYEKATADPWTPVTLAPPSDANATADIRSISSLREVSSMVWLEDFDIEAAGSTAARPGVHMSDSATTLVHGFVLASALLYPISENRELWKRAVLILTSIVWAVVAVFGTETNVAVYFEVTHKPTGSYRPSNFDQALRASKDGGVASGQLIRRKQERIHNLACAKVAQLIQDCRTFDVECNKALNAIQETELVSRGYKLSHPLAPISRIELSANTSRSTRVVPHSAPATGAGSGWGHRPVSLTATAAAAMGHSPRLSWSTWQQQQSIEPEEDVRLLRLRKALSSTLEGAQQKFKSATDNLKPFVDDEEMKLLCEVYDLDSSRASSLVDDDSNDSSSQLRTSSWASRSCAPASDSTRLSSSPTIDEGGSSPVTPVNRNSLFIDASTLGEKYGSLRKRDSGPWDAQAGPSPMRAGSRLSYISDKSPLSGTANGPSNNVAMKRLSYGSSGSGGGGGGLASLSYRTSLQGTQRSGSQSRRLSNLAAQPSLQDLSRPTSPTDAISAPSPVIESTKIIALKTSFENMHHARRRLLCHLLALDFSLRRTVGIKMCTTKSTMRYWLAVGQEMTLLSNTLRRSADGIKRDVHRDLSVKTLEVTKAATDESTQPSSGAEVTPADDKEVDYSGFEDRLMAMGEVLRSVQIKMRLCAVDLSKRKPAPLHGELDATDGEEHLRQKIVEQNKLLTQQGRADAEVMFSTIREDLLTLSAEWETALKIMHVQGLAQVSNASASAKSTNDNSYASVDNSAGIGGLDSPQEADEDALREWVRSRTGGGTEGDLSVSSDIDVEIKELIERKLAEDEDEGDVKGDGMSPGVGDGRGNGKQTEEGMGRGGGDGKGEEDLATLLLRSTSPQHLPPPGVEQVYEDTATPKLPRVSAVPRSREERIRATKLERAAKLSEATKEAAGPPSTSGVIQELQAVMKTRREATMDRVIPLGNSARHNKWGPERV